MKPAHAKKLAAEFLDSGLRATKQATVSQFLRERKGKYGAQVPPDYPSGALILKFTRDIGAERTRRNNAKAYRKRKAEHAKLTEETPLMSDHSPLEESYLERLEKEGPIEKCT